MGSGQGLPTWALHIPSKLPYYTSKKQNGGYFCLRLYHAVEKIVLEKFAQFSKYLFLFLYLKVYNHAKTLGHCKNHDFCIKVIQRK